MGCVFCVLPRSEKFRQPGAWQAYCPTSAMHLTDLFPSLSPLVSWLHSESTVTGVPYVSSGELISACGITGRSQPFQEDMVSNFEQAHNLVEHAVSGTKTAAAPCFPALAAALLLLCL